MRTFILFSLLVITLTSQAQTIQWNNPQDRQAAVAPSQDPLIDQVGYAVFYADYFEGNATALGEIYRHNLMTAAHPKLPLGTIVKITRLDNGLSTTVRINDRGAFCEGCIIDLSRAAAQQIDLIRVGRSRVSLTVLGFSDNNPPPPTNFSSTQTGQQQILARTPVRTYNEITANPYDYNAAQSGPVTYNKSGYNGYNGEIPVVRTYPTQAQPSNYDYNRNTQAPTQQARGGSVAAPQQPQQGNSQVAILSERVRGYAVQFGSYGQLPNAERHVLNLQSKGFNNLYVLPQKRGDGSTINRVVAAPFESIIQAQKYLDELKYYHQMEGLVISIQSN